MLVAGCLHAPVLWSPDGQWLAYTMAVRPGPLVPAAGWLFDTSKATTPGRSTIEKRPAAAPKVYRLWATRVDTGASVLLEESPGPLTSPAWSPDGRALAFGRLVPEGKGHSHFEVVIQDGPEHQRVILKRPHDDFNEVVADLPGLSLAWSPDSRYLAVPSYQQTLDLSIVRVDNGRVVKVIEDAYLPAWSPDGTKLAFVRGVEQQSLHYLDNHFASTRQLARIGHTSQQPVWSRDSRSIWTMSHFAAPRGNGPAPTNLIRINLETQKPETIMAIASRAEDRAKSFLGASFSTDRDNENLFYSRDIVGEPTSIAWVRLQNRETYARFHPIDPSIRIGALAVSPTAPTLALRVGSPGYLSPPALVNLESDQRPLTPLVPDDAARIEWLRIFIDAARGLLRTGLPEAKDQGAGAEVERATLLPVPGELDALERQEVGLRLRKLGQMGRQLCDRPADAPPAEPDLLAFLDEARLFFDYLRQDYTAALTSLEAFEARIDRPDQRRRLMSVRAQIYLGQGDHGAAMDAVNYLQSIQRPADRQLEQTPGGPVLTTRFDPAQAWMRYLARLTEAQRDKAEKQENSPEGAANPFGNENPDAPQFEIPAQPIPFGPGQPGAPPPVPGQRLIPFAPGF
jgi:hypothetical protein